MAASALLACERAAVVQPTVALIHSLGQAKVGRGVISI